MLKILRTGLYRCINLYIYTICARQYRPVWPFCTDPSRIGTRIEGYQSGVGEEEQKKKRRRRREEEGEEASASYERRRRA